MIITILTGALRSSYPILSPLEWHPATWLIVFRRLNMSVFHQQIVRNFLLSLKTSSFVDSFQDAVLNFDVFGLRTHDRDSWLHCRNQGCIILILDIMRACTVTCLILDDSTCRGRRSVLLEASSERSFNQPCFLEVFHHVAERISPQS